MRNPRETGISSITGKMLIIKHASESEQIDVADIMKKRAGESLDLSRDDIVTTSQGDRLLGFAVLKNDARGRSGGRLSLSDDRLHGASLGKCCVIYSLIPRLRMFPQTASLPGILLLWDLSEREGP
jgi:hypothetical protein